MNEDPAIAVQSGSPASLSVLTGLVVAFGWPLLLLIPGVSTHQITSVHDDIVDLCVKWLVVSVLCMIAFSVQLWRLSELGIQ